MTVNKVHVRYCLLFMFNLGTNINEAYSSIYQVYGDTVIDKRSKRFARFKNGDRNLEDKPRAGRPKEFADKGLKSLLQEDATQSTTLLAKCLKVDQSTVVRRLQALGKL
ncbi:PREDICTED: histone-lysine N-methyltransferase SETMAR-like [Dinoponera quadriceps]|uniref:Histone-lysine N-methyltransferase SETMAR-like n=1 Tax=Dinoponera quadriceps TaxID=609295 RepID=A0A6P3Y2B6_DINQU|nr:PREDICTED: histone-lysine N-methyltransferase SETMAR-like [Dinoponera quadriceps]